MSVSEQHKQAVRRRAGFACQYCGVTEQSAGGELTVDHFRPQSQNGADELENLVYCCVRCNLYKGDFWREPESDIEAARLWNPLEEPAANHFWAAENGHLFYLTATGELTIQILRLNRPQLVAFRAAQFLQREESRLLAESETAIEVLLRVNEEQRRVISAQAALLDEQQQLLKLLLNS